MDVEVKAKEILEKAGFEWTDIAATSFAFDSSPPAILVVSIHQVQPPTRNPGVISLDEARGASIAEAFILGHEIPPIEVCLSAPEDGEYKYVVYHGFHRFHLSVAADFTCVPIIIVERLDLSKL